MQSELPNPVNFEAATESCERRTSQKEIPCGIDADLHADAIERWLDAGFDCIAIVALGDLDRFFELWQQELRPRLDSLPAPATP